ncbi:hypothetical protein Z042_10200 [Chania multitudinisentens RB-25]|uniref:Pilus assembly protein HofO n=1 Tax=Chania multitudinisentens RB-25 TaxID=1441930 RepID=W0LDD5_9GAMM|nr:hypothetical protein [Chania multitudinisentens]AHG19965.1 hypothetical protein Z042_10200 [Chania multitudinisentens RB-25]
MDKPLPDWVRLWLNQPSWQLLAIQWLLLAGAILLTSVLLVQGEWQQHEHLQAQRQRLELQIAERRQQLARLPALEELQRRLRAQTSALPAEPQAFGYKLEQVGGVLLRWQQQEQPAQQIVKLKLDFHGLLQLLEGLSPTLRIGQMAIEKQPDGLMTQLILFTLEGEADE